MKNTGSIFMRIPPAVRNLILVNACVFIIQLVPGLDLASYLGLVPAMFWHGAVWQPVTYMFLHGGFFHLLLNMLVLWMFGSALEWEWGTRRFLKFYFICGTGAGLLNAAVTPASPIPVIGASGAIYGLLMAYAVLYPNRLIYFWGIFPIKAKYFVIGIGLIELVTAMSASRSGIAHFAHLGGMLFGLVYMKSGNWRKNLSYRWTEKKRRREIKVVWDRNREKENLQNKVDQLLDKINREGMDSLTSEERERLQKMSRRISDLDE